MIRMDFFDSNAYFSVKAPVMAAIRPMLTAAVCSLAAKHLCRMSRVTRPGFEPPQVKNSYLRWSSEEIDWEYQSVKFYDDAITHLKKAIASQDVGVSVTSSASHLEDILAVIAILCVYELTDAPSTKWRAHLSALPLLRSSLTDNTLTFLEIPRSVFWSLARQDCLSACECYGIHFSIPLSSFPAHC
jgi:hypothetical protein